jgi:hypothetical protein
MIYNYYLSSPLTKRCYELTTGSNLFYKPFVLKNTDGRISMGTNGKISVQRFQRAMGVLAAIGLASVFAIGNAQAATFSAKTIKGAYGCLGKATISTTGISELLRLNFDGTDTVSGTLNLNLGGEQCNLTVTGTYSVNSDGTGKTDLTWAGGAADPDADTNCSMVNGVAQHMGFVIEGNGKAFDFESLDDFLSGGPVTGTDPGDLTDPFVGSCKSQNK